MISYILQTLQVLWLHSSIFALEKESKNLDSQRFLPPEKAPVATFNEKRAPTFGKYVTEQDVLMPYLVQSLHFFDPTPPFLLEKSNLKISVFKVFPLPKRGFGDCFQWNGCTHFQIICSWTSCNKSKLIRGIPIFLVAFLPFFSFFFFFLLEFSFTNIHDSQDSRARGRLFI